MVMSHGVSHLEIPISLLKAAALRHSFKYPSNIEVTSITMAAHQQDDAVWMSTLKVDQRRGYSNIAKALVEHVTCTTDANTTSHLGLIQSCADIQNR